jgi:hypothetical protein
MTPLHRIRRYLALHTYETRQSWRSFKGEFVELWQYWRFRLEMRVHRASPLRVLARLLSMRVPKGQGFGKFGQKELGIYLSADHSIFDPKNDRLFSNEAALRAFNHVIVDDQKVRGRRRIAEEFLMDAQRDGMSKRSRSDCAFEAVYLYALAALGEQAEHYEHPDAQALTAAAAKKGLTTLQIAPAIDYLAKRYAPSSAEIDINAYSLLISIAKTLGEADGDIEPLTPEQHAVFAHAEPTARGKVIESLLPVDVVDYGHEGGMPVEEFLTNHYSRTLPPTTENLAAVKAGKVELRTPAQLAEGAVTLNAKKAQRIERWKTALAVSAGTVGVLGMLIAMATLFFSR